MSRDPSLPRLETAPKSPIDRVPAWRATRAGRRDASTYQGDFEDFALVEIIGKCILISRVYYC